MVSISLLLLGTVPINRNPPIVTDDLPKFHEWTTDVASAAAVTGSLPVEALRFILNIAKTGRRTCNDIEFSSAILPTIFFVVPEQCLLLSTSRFWDPICQKLFLMLQR